MSKKSQSRKKIRSLLTQSMNESLPVRISRTVERHETEHGVVLDMNDDWVLIASIRDGGYLDGYRVFKVGQLRRVEVETTFEKFFHQGEQWPPGPPSPPFELRNPKTIVEGAANAFTIVALYEEVRRPGKCWIGSPVHWGKKSLLLQTIDLGGNWEDYAIKPLFRNLTQVSFGGDYEKALLYVAGDVPSSADGAASGRRRSPAGAPPSVESPKYKTKD